MARAAIFAAAILTALATASAPAVAAGRVPGDIYDRCSVKWPFSLPGFGGGKPAWQERKDASPRSQDVPERIDASVEVDEKDGLLSDMSISWVQNGLMGWPYVWRADLHPIYLIASFRQPDNLSGDSPAFDPAGLKIQLEVLSGRKLHNPLALRFWREGQDRQSLTLGGPADVPAWGKSAEVTVPWPELADYANGQPWLHYELYRPRLAGGYAPKATISEGRVDLSIVPALIEEFRKAEQALRSSVAARRDCERNVEPEPSPDADI
jgi:hypothetical protein